MPLLSSPTLLRIHALSLLYTSYSLLFSPTQFLTHPSLTLLGQSMRLPPAAFQPYANTLTGTVPQVSAAVAEICGLLGLVLGCLAMMELVAAGGLGVGGELRGAGEGGGAEGKGRARGPKGEVVSKERMGEALAVLSAAQNHWMTLAFLRVVLQGGLCIWAYLVVGGRDLLGLRTGVMSSIKEESGSLKLVLGNQVVFTVALMDMLFWGWVWSVIREERREVLRGVQSWKEGVEESERRD